MVTAEVEELVMCTSIYFKLESIRTRNMCPKKGPVKSAQTHTHTPRAFRSIPMGEKVLIVGSCNTLGRAHIGLLVLPYQHPGWATTHTVGPET